MSVVTLTDPVNVAWEAQPPESGMHDHESTSCRRSMLDALRKCEDKQACDDGEHGACEHRDRSRMREGVCQNL